MNERRFAPEEKMKIVLEGLGGTIEISKLCRKYQITTTMFYSWKKQLENSAIVFNDKRGRKPTTERKTEELQQEVARLKTR